MKKTPKSIKLAITVLSLILLLIAVVVVSYAWYFNMNRAKVSPAEVNSDVTPSINAEIPDAFVTSELYSGQTGIEYGTEDMPYVLEYTPVIAEAKYLSSDDYFMRAEICGLNVRLSEKDASGNRIKETYDFKTEEGTEMLSHFTYRLVLTKLIEKETVNGEEVITETYPNLTYKPQNSFLVTDDENEIPLNLRESNIYQFDLKIIFQSEQAYNLLMSGRQNISEEYTFPLSPAKYMFSKMSIFFSVSLDKLHQISLQTNGGVCDEDYLLTTGYGRVTLPDAVKNGYAFEGWYYDAALTIPFVENSLVDNPIERDFTIYAKYKNIVTFDYNMPVGDNVTKQVIVSGGNTVDYFALENIISDWNSSKDYEFLGWTAREDKKNDYQNYQSYKFDFTKSIDESTTLFAVWKPKNKINVTLHPRRDTALTVKSEIRRYDGYNSGNALEGYGEGNAFSFYISDGTALNQFLNTDGDKGIFRSVSTNGKSFNEWRLTLVKEANLDEIRYASDGNIELTADFS